MGAGVVVGILVIGIIKKSQPENNSVKIVITIMTKPKNNFCLFFIKNLPNNEVSVFPLFVSAKV